MRKFELANKVKTSLTVLALSTLIACGSSDSDDSDDSSNGGNNGGNGDITYDFSQYFLPELSANQTGTITFHEYEQELDGSGNELSRFDESYDDLFSVDADGDITYDYGDEMETFSVTASSIDLYIEDQLELNITKMAKIGDELAGGSDSGMEDGYYLEESFSCTLVDHHSSFAAQTLINDWTISETFTDVLEIECVNNLTVWQDDTKASELYSEVDIEASYFAKGKGVVVEYDHDCNFIPSNTGYEGRYSVDNGNTACENVDITVRVQEGIVVDNDSTGGETGGGDTSGGDNSTEYDFAEYFLPPIEANTTLTLNYQELDLELDASGSEIERDVHVYTEEYTADSNGEITVVDGDQKESFAFKTDTIELLEDGNVVLDIQRMVKVGDIIASGNDYGIDDGYYVEANFSCKIEAHHSTFAAQSLSDAWTNSATFSDVLELICTENVTVWQDDSKATLVYDETDMETSYFARNKGQVIGYDHDCNFNLSTVVRDNDRYVDDLTSSACENFDISVDVLSE